MLEIADAADVLAATVPALRSAPVQVLRSGQRCAVSETEHGAAGWFEDAAIVLADRPRDRIVATGPLPGRQLEWEHRVLGWAMPLVLARRGYVCLHACAVTGSHGAVVFCGPSGRGKTVTSLAMCAGGAALLADDIVAVPAFGDGDEPRVTPGPIGSRVLRSDGGKDHLLEQGAARSERLAVIVILRRRSERLAVRPLAPSELFVELCPHLLAGESETFTARRASLAGLSRRIPGFAVTLPDDLVALPEVAAGILAAVQSD
jgi:hypothetical protein